MGVPLAETKEKIKRQGKNLADHDAAVAQAAGTTTDPVGTPNNPSNQVLTVANCITLCRFVLTVAFLVLFVNDGNRAVALSCYAIAAVTDFLDGQVARRTQTVSWVGKIMDPIMDRVLLFTGVLGLMITGELPIWVAVFVIGRDVVLFLGELRLQRYRTRPVDVIYIGKVATALLMTGFCDLLLSVPQIPALHMVHVGWLPGFNDAGAALGIYFVYAGVVCSFITAVRYFQIGFAIKHEVLAERAKAAQKDGPKDAGGVR